MKVNEILAESNEEKLVALGQYMSDRASDESTPSELSVDAFVSIADKLGMSIDFETVSDMLERGVLSDVIADINKKTVKFDGDIENTGDSIIPDDSEQAERHVKGMAHRAMDRRD